jgi:polyisoprenoid-binding protein YceI
MTLRSFRSVAGALVLAMSLSAIAAADRFIDPKSTLSATFTVSKAGALTQFDGAFDISRKAYGIDDPQWNDVLEDNVKVKFHLLQ